MTILKHPIDPCVEFFAVKIINFFISILDFFTGHFLGYTFCYGSNSERTQSDEDYSKGAQIVDVLKFGGFGLIEHVEPSNFAWKHNSYTHPNFVLEHDHVTLYGLTPTHAFFCVSDPAIDITNSDVFPFYPLGQKLSTKQLVLMPLKHFHRLAAEVGNPKCKVICIHMTARCGSTLLSQVFNKVPGVQVYIEPATSDIQRHYIKNRWSTSETNKIIQSTVRLLLKPIHNKKVDYMVWKVTPFTNHHIPVIMEHFPNFKWIFNTRTLRPAMNSILKTANFQPFVYTYTGLFIHSFWWDHCSVSRDSPVWRKIIEDYREAGLYFNRKYTPTEMLGVGGVSFFANYLRDKKKYDICVFYEDLVEDPRAEIGRLFRAVGVDLKHLDLALTALKTDSQHGVLCARGADKALVTEAEFETIDRVFQEVGIPFNSKMNLADMKQVFDIPVSS